MQPITMIINMALSAYLCDGNKDKQIKRLARKYMNLYAMYDEGLRAMLNTILEHDTPSLVVLVSYSQLKDKL